MKPVKQNFLLAALVATCRFANRKRDSLTYSALAVAGGELLMNGRPLYISCVFAVAAAREMMRGHMWMAYEQNRLVSNQPEKVEALANSAACMVTTGLGVACSASIFSIQYPSAATLILPGAFAVLLGKSNLARQGKGFRDIIDLYFNKETGMWDWPDKRDGTGGSMRKQLTAAFKKLGRKIGGATAPQPVPGAARMALYQAAKPSA